MSRILTVATISMLIALGGCGDAGFEKGDGTIDRDLFRSDSIRSCGFGLSLRSDAPSQEERDHLCNCIADRLLTQSDAELRAMINNSSLQDREFQAAIRHCTSGAEADPSVADIAPPEQLLDRTGAFPRPGDPPPPPLGALLPPPGAPADSGPLPVPNAAKAIIRNRSGRGLICGQDTPFPTNQLESGADFNVLPGRVHCGVPVQPPAFDIAAGHIYDFVPDGNHGVTVRDVTAGR
jgi:hypothetical protein